MWKRDVNFYFEIIWGVSNEHEDLVEEEGFLIQSLKKLDATSTDQWSAQLFKMK